MKNMALNTIKIDNRVCNFTTLATKPRTLKTCGRSLSSGHGGVTAWGGKAMKRQHCEVVHKAEAMGK
ncbi:hypothetical protein L6452_09971 [Arctium lappa]|uniref:Uncharacterized protein n=1 Tax=Arctium lappa TaxID=4217 RepID=A0ACB9DLV9_ARCLA|nr:hypothetical protein L6452_09971 [Arctium lappa]